MSNPQTTATAKAINNMDQYLMKIKPRMTKEFGEKKWYKLSDVIVGLITGKSIFLTTISANTSHYSKKKKEFDRGKRKKILAKSPQIDKISGYLKLPVDRVMKTYYRFVRKEYFADQKSFNELRSHSIQERVFYQRICCHDGSDIQKPHSYKAEGRCKVRDGSKSSSKKTITGLGYPLEGSIAFTQGKIYPLILNLYSTISKNFKSGKSETLNNFDTLSSHGLLDLFLHILDRGYDDASFMKECITRCMDFLIRAMKNRNIVMRDAFEGGICECKTQKEKNNLFENIELVANRLSYQKHSDYSWFKIAWTPIYMKGPGFPKDDTDILPLYLISVRIVDSKIKGIDEDTENGEFERELLFYTTKEVKTIEDAITLFLLYLLRWKIETFFRYLKQVFQLESIQVKSFEKKQNLCKLLVLATHYLYQHFHDFKENYEKTESITPKSLFQKEKSKRNQGIILQEYFYCFYLQFLREEGLTINIDSFTKFFHDLMKRSRPRYSQNTINTVYYDDS